MNLQTPGERNFRFLVSVALAFVAGASITEAMSGGCITRECALLSIGWGAFWGAGFGVISSMQNRVCAEYEHKNAASLEDTQPVKVKSHPIDNRGDLSAMPERTFEEVQNGYWRVLDLNRAAGRPGAAAIFTASLSRNGGDLRVETWKAQRGVGREAFERMRAELARMGYVTTGAKGAYQWSDAGRKWLASLPR